MLFFAWKTLEFHVLKFWKVLENSVVMSVGTLSLALLSLNLLVNRPILFPGPRL